MQEIAAEDITDFDTSLDRLWARRDLVVLVTGALICLRSIHRRALRIGALPRLRYLRLRAEDYVFGTAEEELRAAVRTAACLPGTRVIVIYLSCLDILVRPDFADIERSLTAETGCTVRCFFRGPLAKTDSIPHMAAEEILAQLPPEEGEVTAPPALPPPTSDAAGIADFLRTADTARVLVTPSGCRMALARSDITEERRDVYALIPHAEDYVFGMEETAAEEVGSLAAEGRYRAIYLLTSPVPAFMAMAAAPVLDAAEEHGCRASCSLTDGFHDGVYGVAEETRRLVEEASVSWRACRNAVLVLGDSPLLFGDRAQLDAAIADFTAYGLRTVIAGRDALTEQPVLVWVVSAAGITAAEWLHERYGTPIVRSLPLGVVGRAAWRADVMQALGRDGGDVPCAGDRIVMPHTERILVIGDPIASAALSRLLSTHGWRDIRSAAYAWDAQTAEIYRRASDGTVLHIVHTAEELQPAWDAADIVIADPLLIPAMGEKRILALPCGLLSGRDAAGGGSGVLGADFAAVLRDFLTV